MRARQIPRMILAHHASALAAAALLAGCGFQSFARSDAAVERATAALAVEERARLAVANCPEQAITIDEDS